MLIFQRNNLFYFMISNDYKNIQILYILINYINKSVKYFLNVFKKYIIKSNGDNQKLYVEYFKNISGVKLSKNFRHF